MGLPGSGKTTLAKQLVPMFNAVWLNADEVRKEADDWDFTPEGRLRQANRMKTLAQEAVANNRVVVAMTQIKFLKHLANMISKLDTWTQLCGHF